MNLRIRYIIVLAFLLILISPANHTAKANKTEAASDKKINFLPYSSSTKNIYYSAPSHSCTVKLLPWEADPEFLTAQNENKTPVQLANFCTVLRDPLPGEETNVHIAARILKGTVVQPGKVFSQNAAVGPYNQSRGFQLGPVYIGSQLSTTIGGGVCKIASTLYNVAILSNLPVVERYAHSMPVPYVPLGQDATVCYGVKDLKFINNTSSPILIWAEGIDNRLYVAFYGQTAPPSVEWHHEMVKQIKTYNIYRSNFTVKKGNEKIVLEGMDGAIVRSWLTIKDSKKGKTIKKSLGKDYYNPMPGVVELGMMNQNSETYQETPHEN